MIKRVISGTIVFAIVLLVFLIGNQYIVDVFLGIVAMRCIYELFHTFEQKGHHPVSWIGYLASALIMLLHIIPSKYIIITLATIIPVAIVTLFIQLLTKKTSIKVVDVAITLFGICYIVLFLAFMSLIRALENGRWLVWYVFIASWLTDVFALFTGKTIGKHHFTDISPNKTIEGCIGGTLGAVIGMILYTIALNNILGLEINYIVIAVSGLILSIVGQIGDLAASSIKRYAGMKDFSDLIPGHGGMVDRMDSVIFIAPFAYLVLMYLI